MYTCIGGLDCEANQEIVLVSFVRACVRACEGAGEARKSYVRVGGVVASEAGWQAVSLCCGVAWRGVAWWRAPPQIYR